MNRPKPTGPREHPRRDGTRKPHARARTLARKQQRAVKARSQG